jgi:hypothetical protein
MQPWETVDRILFRQWSQVYILPACMTTRHRMRQIQFFSYTIVSAITHTDFSHTLFSSFIMNVIRTQRDMLLDSGPLHRHLEVLYHRSSVNYLRLILPLVEFDRSLRDQSQHDPCHQCHNSCLHCFRHCDQ